ncbi:MAG: NADH-quinone oxidoreductase subunit NuoK [Candidatus Aminicenantes bacterium]|jgi:NADH-quinone oxidoreductase subunit K|nr:NADH-quinone oxidoreductase subunit NuoK [Candidatus Aminicenantes bacterium]MDH5385590.1 NADH-quinone oxidoreductase subunit NuoK [Candidatus Aminicenantes bacterium]MDH5743594.1 NADH-quinone oxidoreductase subunit NuoK [Candidatus Aminicenantes bacterium]
MIPLSYFLILSIILFVLGAIGFFIKRDLITQFMTVEIMLNAANLAFITFAKSASSLDGQVIVFFIITVAAAEAAVGLAIILLVYRQKKTIKSEDIKLMKG